MGHAHGCAPAALRTHEWYQWIRVTLAFPPTPGNCPPCSLLSAHVPEVTRKEVLQGMWKNLQVTGQMIGCEPAPFSWEGPAWSGPAPSPSSPRATHSPANGSLENGGT